MENGPNALGTDEAFLATLGYKQEFRREFTALEVFGVAFSIIGVLPSIAYVPTAFQASWHLLIPCTARFSSTPFPMAALLRWSGVCVFLFSFIIGH